MLTSALVVPGELAGSAATLFLFVDTDKVLLLMVVATTMDCLLEMQKSIKNE